jgi:hypothetical protein
MQPYVRTQHAAWMWWILLPVLAIVASAWFTSPGLATLLPLALVIVIIGAVGAVFTRLTIRVDADAMTWHFGWGWPSSAISMREIERAEVTQTNLLEGWGIHWTIWHGWLWNVGGFQAVEIFKRNGSGVTLGSDDPQGLFQAIERFRKGAA